MEKRLCVVEEVGGIPPAGQVTGYHKQANVLNDACDVLGQNVNEWGFSRFGSPWKSEVFAKMDVRDVDNCGSAQTDYIGDNFGGIERRRLRTESNRKESVFFHRNGRETPYKVAPANSIDSS